MKELEIKTALESAIKNFEEKYPEWADYTLALKKDGIEVEVVSDGNKLNIEAAKELLRDFAVELKKQNLMITSQNQGDFTVGEYVYTFEEGLEDLADELELKLGNYFSNLSVSAHDNKPYVRFVYIGSLTSKDKEKLLDQVKTITEQYKPIDPDDIFSDVEFEELDEVLEEIEGKNFDDMIEAEFEETKAEDTYEAVDRVSEGYTCEEIAEMHGVDLDFIMDQLEKGIEIEMEHTDDPEEAKAIAKDHLFEIPDYYDRLEQMEEEAEAEPMLSDGTDEEDDNFTIDSSEEIDEEGAMAKVQLKKIIKNAEELLDLLEDESQLPAWVQAKLTLADHNLEASADYLLYEGEKSEDKDEEIKAEDDYEVNKNIPVTPKNDELIWNAERDLIKAIDEGDFEKAQSLFDFIYNFDILAASETMGQFEDLWNRKDKYQEEIYELSLYEMFDEYDN